MNRALRLEQLCSHFLVFLLANPFVCLIDDCSRILITMGFITMKNPPVGSSFFYFFQPPTSKSKCFFSNWAVLSDEQVSNGYPCSLLNDEQMSNKVGVKHQPANPH